jgi:hypothetical protein
MNKTYEQRLRHVEDLLESIHTMLVMGREAVPGRAEYDQAIAELLKGNPKPLAEFKRRGGIIPLSIYGGSDKTSSGCRKTGSSSPA